MHAGSRCGGLGLFYARAFHRWAMMQRARKIPSGDRKIAMTIRNRSKG